MSFFYGPVLSADGADTFKVVPLVQLEIDARRIPCWYEYGAAELRELGRPTTVELICMLREFV